MKLTRSLAVCAVLFAYLNLLGCAGLCARKDNWFTNSCTGSDVTYTPDSLCQHNMDNCSEQKLRAFEDWVGCLESKKECSLEAINDCNQKYPAGVNMQCPKKV